MIALWRSSIVSTINACQVIGIGFILLDQFIDSVQDSVWLNRIDYNQANQKRQQIATYFLSKTVSQLGMAF